MKIYPDPELPDIEATWYDGDCREGTGDVRVEVTGIDDPTDHLEAAAPCIDARLAFPDVARERYHVVGTLLDDAGAPFSAWDAIVDLRNGIGQRVDLYFGGGANVRVTWMFDAGASCESLGASTVVGRFTRAGNPQPYGVPALCQAGAVFASLPEGPFTVELRALAATGVVAPSVPTPRDVMPAGLTSVGPLTLTPCDAPCPTERATLAR